MALDFSALKQPRRIVTALALFALLAGGTGGIVGVAMASSDAPTSVGAVTIPEPRVGDFGEYKLRVVDLPQPGAPVDGLPTKDAKNSGSLRFDFRMPHAIVDKNGQPHQVAALGYDDETPATEDDLHWEFETHYGVLVDLNTWSTEAFLDQWFDEETKQTDAGPVESYSNSRSWDFHDEEHGVGPLPVCGMMLGVQGTTIIGGESGVGLPACRYAHDRHDARGVWTVLGTVEDNLRRYALVEVESLGFTARIWYEDGIPVPSRVEVTDRFNPLRSGTLVAELTAFTRGDGPSAYTRLAAPTPAPLQYAPATDTMFDETGIDHPFPASQAVAVAKDMQESGLAEFLRDHPDAYITDASYWQYHGIGDGWEWMEYEWRFLVRERDAFLDVDIGMREVIAEPEPVTQGPLDDLLGNPPPANSERPSEGHYLFQAGTTDPERLDPWFPKPAELPTVASMWAFYEAMAHGEAGTLEPNMWEWSILESNDERRLIIRAGRFLDTPYPEGEDYSYHREWAYISIEPDDAPEPYRYAQRFRVSGLPNEPAPGKVEPANAEVVHLTGWRLPAGAAAAIGAGAGLLAVVYYVWPVLKSGLFGGLFSRVQPAAALENPRRAEVFALVQQHPGVHFQEVVRAVGLAEGNTKYHLAKLEQLGLIMSKRAGGYTCYFEKGKVDRHVMAGLTNVRSPSAKAILATVIAKPGVTNAQLEKRHKLAKGTVSYHLAKLRKAGLIASNNGHRPTDLAKQVSAVA